MLAQLQAAPSGGRRIAPLWGADLKATSFGRGFFTGELGAGTSHFALVICHLSHPASGIFDLRLSIYDLVQVGHLVSGIRHLA